jgi:hypothetical protein
VIPGFGASSERACRFSDPLTNQQDNQTLMKTSELKITNTIVGAEICLADLSDLHEASGGIRSEEREEDEGWGGPDVKRARNSYREVIVGNGG